MNREKTKKRELISHKLRKETIKSKNHFQKQILYQTINLSKQNVNF